MLLHKNRVFCFKGSNLLKIKNLGMDFLHIFLISCFSISSFFVYFSSNPIHSILFLIISFFEASLTLLLFQLEFLGFLFLIIYVGAIAVLFLFVIMMLESKLLSSAWHMYMLGFTFLKFFISIQVFFSFADLFLFPFFNLSEIWVFFDDIDNLKNFGQVLYNYYLESVLLAGLILLIAVIGPITLTLRFYR